ncbi:Hypothetical predicted protein, partial [Olea europaea subsp. europaea]
RKVQHMDGGAQPDKHLDVTVSAIVVSKPTTYRTQTESSLHLYQLVGLSHKSKASPMSVAILRICINLRPDRPRFFYRP